MAIVNTVVSGESFASLQPRERYYFIDTLCFKVIGLPSALGFSLLSLVVLMFSFFVAEDQIS